MKNTTSVIIERLKEAMTSPSIPVPPGLTKEQLHEFILAQANNSKAS